MLRGNVTAQIFWLKTRARRRETPLELKHSGSIARKDPSELSDEELFALILSDGQPNRSKRNLRMRCPGHSDAQCFRKHHTSR
jgi:hypothetical protein